MTILEDDRLEEQRESQEMRLTVHERPTLPTALKGTLSRPPSDLVASFLDNSCWQHCTFSTLQLKSLAASTLLVWVLVVSVESVVPLLRSALAPPRLAILKGSGVASVAEGRRTKMAAKTTKRVMIERNIVG